MNRYELFYNFMQALTLEQTDRMRAISVSAMGCMTLSLAALGISGLTIANYEWGEDNLLQWDDDNFLQMLTLIFAMVTLGAFLCVVGFAIGASYVREWRINPHPSVLRSHISNEEYEDDAIIEWTANSMVDAYLCNHETLLEKAARLRHAIMGFWVQIIFTLFLMVSVRLYAG